MKNLKQKKIFVTFLAVLCAMFFLTGAKISSASCGDVSSKTQSFLNNLARLGNKALEGLKIEPVFSAEPDPDTCGNDSFSCSGNQLMLTINWDAAPEQIAPSWCTTYLGMPYRYLVAISGLGKYQVGDYSNNTTTLTVAANPDTTYVWSVNACWGGAGSCSLTSACGPGIIIPGGSASTALTCTPAPTVTLSASPTTINSGDSSTLTWTSTDAASCIATDGNPLWIGWAGGISLKGSLAHPFVNATANPITTNFGFTCTNATGSTSANASVTVNPAAASPQPQPQPTPGTPEESVWKEVAP